MVPPSLTPALPLGEAADEADWRALAEKALKGAPWTQLIQRIADAEIGPLYREDDFATATDVSGFPGAAPFIRGARATGRWTIRQIVDHPDPERANRDALADLEGGVASIELVIGSNGLAIESAADLNLALAGVILEAAPIALDAGARGLWAADLLAAKLKGVAAEGTAFNLDPIGALMREGRIAPDDLAAAARFSARARETMPLATTLRVDARPVHEAGGSEAQEIAVALSTGIAYLRALEPEGLPPAEAGATLLFTCATGPDVLVECAKLRALRLCWARVMEASGAAPDARAARIQAVSSRRMMTRYDAWTNILRVTTSASAATIGGADVITTLPFTDALGLPTPFARRLARNTQHVLFEEARLGHVIDPAGGAWFVEKLTRDLAAAAWAKMQALEAQGGIVHAFTSGALQREVSAVRDARARAFATRSETITGVTDFPLLDAPLPSFAMRTPAAAPANVDFEPLVPIRWATPFEALRDRAEQMQPRPSAFFANLGSFTEFGARAQFARNLLAAGGVASIGDDEAYASRDAMIAAFRTQATRVAVICGADGAEASEAARQLKAAGARWIVYAGKPSEALRQAGVDQFVFTGCDAHEALRTLHAALGVK